MSRTEGASPEYELHVDAHGALVVVRGRVSAELLQTIISEMVAHPKFHLELPSVWDMRASEGFGHMSRAELSKLVMISRQARSGSKGYRVAMVAGGTLDFGVGRMLGGTVERGDVMEVAIFYDFDEATRWAFGKGHASASGSDPT